MTAQEKEMVRHAAIECLAVRPGVALPVSAIRRKVTVEVPFAVTDADVEESMAFLQEKKFVRFVFDEIGSTKWWSATSEGIQYVERGQVSRKPGHD